ncbi:hypothetical protein [uncultured Pseudophaeobacter sp.]|jgi:hypothetical protein|uniref:hypothetical protein n=1 Tax=uncultured Pseudophaeobacter sp. TaxID=1759421 RepID=UPI0025CFAC06|nr:hypothetical protein [uncultured Pseudophaeobacter sp.]
MDYKVLRPHLGDKAYLPGDVRSAKPASVSHLVAKAVLAPVTQEEPSSEDGQKAVAENSGNAAGARTALENKADEPPQNAATTGPGAAETTNSQT